MAPRVVQARITAMTAATRAQGIPDLIGYLSMMVLSMTATDLGDRCGRIGELTGLFGRWKYRAGMLVIAGQVH